jgi:glucosylceramidase
VRDRGEWFQLRGAFEVRTCLEIRSARLGSDRIASNNLDSLPNVAFQTPDKRIVLIVVNAAQTAQTFHIRHRGKRITPVLAPGAVGTYIW